VSDTDLRVKGEDRPATHGGAFDVCWKRGGVPSSNDGQLRYSGAPRPEQRAGRAIGAKPRKLALLMDGLVASATRDARDRLLRENSTMNFLNVVGASDDVKVTYGGEFDDDVIFLDMYSAEIDQARARRPGIAIGAEALRLGTRFALAAG